MRAASFVVVILIVVFREGVKSGAALSSTAGASRTLTVAGTMALTARRSRRLFGVARF